MNKEEDFIQLIHNYEKVIFKIATAYAVDKEDLKDLYQDIVYQLWKSFSLFKGQSHVSTWIYRVCLNTSITYKKRRVSKASILSSKAKFTLPDDGGQLEKDERREVMYRHIRNLSEIDRGIVLLYLEEKSHEEIAAITGFTRSNIGTRINRIKRKLKMQIQKTQSWN